MSWNNNQNQNGQQNQKPRKPPCVIDDLKLRVYAANPIEPGAKKPYARLKMRENNPILYFDYGTRKNDRPISHDTAINPVVLRQIQRVMQIATRTKEPFSVVFNNWGKPFVLDKATGQRGPAKEPMNISNLEVGRNAAGIIFWKYSAYGKPDLEFEFGEDQWHHLKTADGNPLPPQLASDIVGTAAIDAWVAAYDYEFSAKWEEPEFLKRFREQNMQKGQGGSNWGGGQQQQGGWNGGGQSQPQQQPQQQQQNSFGGDGGLDSIPF